MKKFETGQRVSYSMLYGGRVTAIVSNVTDEEVVLTESWFAEDMLETVSEDTTYQKYTNEDGDEYIVIWEYKGEVGRLYGED
jgi:hypothetical protein